MQYNQKKHPITLYFGIAFFYFILFLITRIPGLSLKINNSTPFLLLPALIAGTIFFKEWFGFIGGIFLGLLQDSVQITGCFNLIALMLLGAIAGIAAAHFLNQNIRATVALTFVISLIYFLLKWFIFIFLKSKEDAFIYLIEISLPSVLYTTVFAVPFYFLFKWVNNKFL